MFLLTPYVQRTTQTVECTHTGSVVLNSSSESDGSFLDLSLKSPDQGSSLSVNLLLQCFHCLISGPRSIIWSLCFTALQKILQNYTKNSWKMKRKIFSWLGLARDLGGIPAMIHHSDMSNTIPDEGKVKSSLTVITLSNQSLRWWEVSCSLSHRNFCLHLSVLS